MTGDGTDALEQALALHATPGRLPMLHKRPLPRAVLLLIRIAAGDGEAIASAVARTAETRQVVTDAAVLYIEQVLFREATDSYRLLGVHADAGADTIKEHYRWLMRWLHPDRHPERWEVVYSERVNRAWNSLNSELRRSDYDAHALATGLDARAAVAPMRVIKRSPVTTASHPLLSPRIIRNLPALVLGGLAVVAAAVLSLLYWVQRDQQAVVIAAPEKPAAANYDASTAQEEAIRQRVAFDEHVIELSQPTLPPGKPVAEQPVTSDAPAQQAAADALEAHSASAVADAGSETTESVLHAASPPPNPTSLKGLSVPRGKDGIAFSHPVVGPTPVSIASHAVPVPVRDAATPARSRQPSLVASIVSPARRTLPPSRTTMDPNPNTLPALDAPAAALPTTAIVPSDGMSSEHAVTVVPREFESAYANGDLTQLMGLFAPNAVDNRGGIDAIREDYDHLFRSSSARELHLDDLKWVIQPDRIVGSGEFKARIRRNDEETANHVHGWIQIVAVPIDGRWKIQRLLHRDAE